MKNSYKLAGFIIASLALTGCVNLEAIQRQREHQAREDRLEGFGDQRRIADSMRERFRDTSIHHESAQPTMIPPTAPSAPPVHSH